MGRMSDIDIEVRLQLEEEAEHLCLTNYEKQVYIDNNYERLGKEVMKRHATSSKPVPRMVR